MAKETFDAFAPEMPTETNVMERFEAIAGTLGVTALQDTAETFEQ